MRRYKKSVLDKEKEKGKNIFNIDYIFKISGFIIVFETPCAVVSLGIDLDQSWQNVTPKYFFVSFFVQDGF
jgi:hypothetical protein